MDWIGLDNWTPRPNIKLSNSNGIDLRRNFKISAFKYEGIYLDQWTTIDHQKVSNVSIIYKAYNASLTEALTVK